MTEIFLLGARSYQDKDKNIAKVLYKRALASAEKECGIDSAAAGLVLIEFAQFSEHHSSEVEAQHFNQRVRRILGLYSDRFADRGSAIASPEPRAERAPQA